MNETKWHDPIPETNEQRRIDPQNPFENSMENSEYRTDYRRILPQILLPGFRIPLFPERDERREIRKRMNIAGFWMLLGMLAPQILFIVAELIILALMGVSFSSLRDTGAVDAEFYISESSILIALNGLLFAVINTAAALLGCYSAKIKPRSLFSARRLKVPTMLRYIVTGIGLQFVAAIVYLIVEQLFAQNGVELSEADFSFFESQKSLIATFMYTCVLAPVTEELLYRGFLLKTLSCVSVRFGIVVSALMFGLAHGNVSQFLLGFLVGLFLGKIVTRHNSLAPSILVHMGINTMSMVLSLVSEWGDTSLLTALVSLFYYGVAIVGIIFWFWKERPQPLPYPTQKQVARNRIFCSSPWLLIAIAVQIGLMTVVMLVS